MSIPCRDGIDAHETVAACLPPTMPCRSLPRVNDPVVRDAVPYLGTVSRNRFTLVMYPGRSTK